MSMQPSLADLAPRATANLLATYLAIGRAFPGSEMRETDGYLALLSDLPHPSGNFAARLHLDPWSAGELRALAASRPAFQAVALPDDGPEHLPELLRRAGFEPVQRLVAMVATPTYGLAALDMAACEEPEDRRRIARFMADVFFARESVSLRMTMAEAVVEAAPLSVYGHLSRERPVAAVTLMRSEGMLGIYNLCVAGAQRGRGRRLPRVPSMRSYPGALVRAPRLRAVRLDHGVGPGREEVRGKWEKEKKECYFLPPLYSFPFASYFVIVTRSISRPGLGVSPLTSGTAARIVRPRRPE
jgi:hypothetical protein